MNQINRHNYEVFFIDYLEGKLPSSRADELIAFLRENPDLYDELQSWEEVRLCPDETIRMEPKDGLKKHSILPDANHFDEICIASIEGDLTAQETQTFETYL